MGIEKTGDVGGEGNVKLGAGHGEPWGGARGGGTADVGFEVPPPVGVKVCNDVVKAGEDAGAEDGARGEGGAPSRRASGGRRRSCCCCC